MEWKWLVARTRPQWERIVVKQLHNWYQIECWCPFQTIWRQYTDRIKQVEVPLFRNYVFVRIGNYQQYVQVLQLDGVIGFVQYLGKPAVIKDPEMERLKNLVKDHPTMKKSQLLRELPQVSSTL